jgi:hypothetical protein
MLGAMRRTIFLLLCIAMAAISFGQSPQSAAPSEKAVDTGKNGTLVVLVTWDDANTTPTTGAYVEAHSFNFNWVSEKSFVLKMVKPGRYEAALPSGVYDVFVSEASSTPRALVTADHTGYWKLMVEHDVVYLARGALDRIQGHALSGSGQCRG